MATRSQARWGRSRRERTTRSWVDHDVVAAARKGDPESFGKLYTVAAPRVVAFFRYSGLTGDEADDLTADVMETVIRKLAGLRDLKAFEGWLWAIARNHLAGHLRKQRSRRPEAPTPQQMEPPEHVALAEEHRVIREALARLPERDRQLLWLREVEGLSHAEIGGRLGAATGAVRVALHRARRRLEAAYEEVDHE